jgi:pyruvate formate lyase activating enzyme
MKEALYYNKQKNKIVNCNLCPQNCFIKESDVGFCGVRKNDKGKLNSLVYGKPCSISIDPIEKKPLYHFYPGEKAFSIGTIGCNLGCLFCQNWQISMARREKIDLKEVSPEEIIKLVKKNNCRIISYTYNEPTVFFEYMIEIAKLARKEGIKNTIVSNGYINEEPLMELCKYMDGANIDLKAFDDTFYKKNCSGRLEPVLKTLKILIEKKVWVEVTNLIIPGLNDDFKRIEEMCKWISEELGKDVPLHFSRFTPMYKMKDRKMTPVETLDKAEEIAKKYLHYVYVGNIWRESNTICPKCGKVLIQREGYETKKLIKGDRCDCGEKIKGEF